MGYVSEETIQRVRAEGDLEIARVKFQIKDLELQLLNARNRLESLETARSD